MAALMILVCAVMVLGTHPGFPKRQDAGPATTEAPHLQIDRTGRVDNERT